MAVIHAFDGIFFFHFLFARIRSFRYHLHDVELISIFIEIKEWHSVKMEIFSLFPSFPKNFGAAKMEFKSPLFRVLRSFREPEHFDESHTIWCKEWQ